MADDTPRPMTPQDITRIVWVSEPQISPDGRRVAFVATTLSEEKDEYLSQIWVVDAAGGAPRRFTAGPKRDTEPRWSPDGSRLAFISEREAKKKGQLYVMPADGGEPARLTDVKAGVRNPVWSPDGTQLCVVSRVGGWEEPDAEEDKQKSRPARVITTLKYKYNGEGFTYDRRPHLFVVPVEGGPAKQITDGDVVDADPVWSPDGRFIAFASARHDDRDHDDASDIWLVDAGGGPPRRVTDTSGPAGLPSFAPDGRTLAYVGRRRLNDFGGNIRVFTISADGGPSVCLTSTFDRSCAPLAVRPLWSPDGGSITFAAEDQGSLSLYHAEASGSAPPRRVIDGERVVSGFSTSRDGTFAFVASDPVTPAEVFIARADGSGERRLTDLNRAWREGVALSRPERFRFTRAGVEVDGWVMKPPGLSERTKRPALLNIHGGPHAQYGHGFFDEFQVYAGAGYVVVYVNPRGSQGYGEAFTRAVIRDWGGGDYADVMAGLDEALRGHEVIDGDRLGVMGGSYGGFLTSWIVGHTGRFRAACSERAVNDQWAMFGTSDIGHLFNVVELGVTPWDDAKEYLERSPLSYAKDVTTPLLIIHSEDDLRCPMSQAEQLFVALKKHRKDVTFVRFPDENHELSRSGKPRHRLARFGFILDWFARHLSPAVSGVRGTGTAAGGGGTS
ncbi:MAG TPA: S9 family peptidase [Candidatus Methylomirabilis sp.]|nr:S9 family peptidase [Candidatus Methylomirabilis sp.]